MAVQKKSASPRAAGAAKKVATKKAPAKSATKAAKTAAKGATKSATTKAAAKKAPAKKPATTKPAATKTAPVKATKTVGKAATPAPEKSAAKPAKSPLSAADVREFRKLISGEVDSLRKEYDASIAVLDELKANGSDNAGDDPADAGTKTFEREHEMSIANNRLDLIGQMERALERLDEGTYGLCESCGKPIPKGRLQAFPSATLCVACKSREERR